MRRRWYLFAPIGIAAITLFAFIGGEAVRLLWNWLTPMLFGWRQITFWQALGLLTLCRILLGGWGGRGGSRRWRRGHWEKMTPEERERMREGYRRRWDCMPPAEEAPKA